jgi:hypothetical protein
LSERFEHVSVGEERRSFKLRKAFDELFSVKKKKENNNKRNK